MSAEVQQPLDQNVVADQRVPIEDTLPMVVVDCLGLEAPVVDEKIAPSQDVSVPVVVLEKQSLEKKEDDGAQESQSKKQETIDTSLPPGSKPPTSGKKRRAKVQCKKAPDCNAVIEKVSNIVDERASVVGATTGGLFSFSECISLNDFGDVRFSDCVLNVPIGPFRILEHVKIVDWLASSSTMMVSNTGRVVDSVLFAIQPASVGVTPIPMALNE
jgi:hypothetical protein